MRLFACYFSDRETHHRGFSPGLSGSTGKELDGWTLSLSWFCTLPLPQLEVDLELVRLYGLSSIISPSDTRTEVALQSLRNDINSEPL